MEAIQLYTLAISLCPNNAIFYSNRYVQCCWCISLNCQDKQHLEFVEIQHVCLRHNDFFLVP